MTTLSITGAAKLLGVSQSTVKRLCAQGQLPYVTTAGGHRRFQLAMLENASLRNATLLTEAHHSAILPDVAELLGQLLEANVNQIALWLDQIPITRKSVVSLLDELLAPALWQLGEQFRAGELESHQVRLATRMAQRLLEILASQVRLNAPSRFVAVGGTVAGNHDLLAGNMVRIALKLLPATAIHLGCNLPAEALASAARRFDARVVWVSHTHITDIDAVIRWHAELSKALPPEVRVIVGGGALSPAIRHSLKCHAYYTSLAALLSGEGEARGSAHQSP